MRIFLQSGFINNNSSFQNVIELFFATQSFNAYQSYHTEFRNL